MTLSEYKYIGTKWAKIIIKINIFGWWCAMGIFFRFNVKNAPRLKKTKQKKHPIAEKIATTETESEQGGFLE